MTDTLSRLSLNFSFDSELFTSNVYGRFFRELTKRNTGRSQTRASAVERETGTNDASELYHQRLLLIGNEYSGVDSVLHEIISVWENHPNNFHLQQMVVYRFVILRMKTILTSLSIGGISFQSEINAHYSAFLLQYVDDISLRQPLDGRAGEAVRSLWHDPSMDGVRQAPQSFDIADSTLVCTLELNPRIAQPNRQTEPLRRS